MDNTNSQGAQYRPIQINYGAIAQNHVRYMNKYKSDEEAKNYARKSQEREFKRKISSDRGKLLPEISIGDIQGLYRDQRVELYKKEAKELSALKQDFKNTGNIESKLKYQNRAEFYKNANALTGAFNDFAKYYAENQKDYNPYLDSGKKQLAEHLAKGRFELTRDGLKIPADDMVLYEFNLSEKDADKDGFVTIPNSVMSEKLTNSGKFSGKPQFDVTGSEIAKGVVLDDINGNIKVTPKDELESIRQWKSQLLENPTQLQTIAKINNFDKNKEITDVELTTWANQLHTKYTLPRWKTVDNSLANRKKKASINASNRSNREPKNAETISLATDGLNNISEPNSVGIGSGKFPEKIGFKAIVNLPKAVKYGSPSSKGNVVIEQLKQDNNGKWSAVGFKVTSVKDGEPVDGEQFYKDSSEKIELTDTKDINAIVKKIKTGKGLKDQFDNLTEFEQKVNELSNDNPEQTTSTKVKKKVIDIDDNGNPIYEK